jgi:hypothetical protein
MLALGKVPLYIPEPVIEAMVSGQDIYEIQFISPAARMLRAGELRGIMGTWEFIGAYAQAAPEMIQRVSAAKSVDLIAELSGAPLDLLVAEEEFQQAMEALKKAQEIQASMATQSAEASITQQDTQSAQQIAQAQSLQRQ